MELGENYYNINNEDDRKMIQNALRTKEGQTIMKYIFQVFEEEFDEDNIKLDQDNYKVGEEFKIIKRYKNIKNRIYKLINNSNE